MEVAYFEQSSILLRRQAPRESVDDGINADEILLMNRTSISHTSLAFKIKITLETKIID